MTGFASLNASYALDLTRHAALQWVGSSSDHMNA
jgi:hypothetical protein